MNGNIPIVFGQPDPGPAPRPKPQLNELQQKKLQELKDQHEGVVYRLGSIENEISDLHREQEELEERQVDLEEEIADLVAIQRDPLPMSDAWEDLYRWACGCCPWDTAVDNDSARFRAEVHAHETGHVVVLLAAGGVPGFDDAIAEVRS